MEQPAQSYASMVKSRLAHAPVQRSPAEEKSVAEKLQRHERVEPELVAAAVHLGQHADLHPTRASGVT